ncbi:MAG: TVP38/TMEM64 family protein [Terriglobia bacterium]
MPETAGLFRKLAPRLLIIGALVALLVAFYVFGGGRLLNLYYLLAEDHALKILVQRHYVSALFVAGTVYILTAALSLPVDVILSLLIGFLFGRWVGGTLIVISATLGATIIFLIARYLIGGLVRKRLEHRPSAARLMHAFEQHVFNYLLFVRLVPLFPFSLVNLAAAFTAIRLQQFIAGTFIGIIPGSFIYANLGQQFGGLHSLHGLLSPGLIGALALLGIFTLLPVAAHHWRTVCHREV